MYKKGKCYWAKIKGNYYNLGKSKRDAAQLETELRRALDAERGGFLKTDLITVGDFLDHFYDQHCVVHYRPSTLEGTPYLIRSLKKAVGDWFLSELTEQKIRYCIVARLKEGVSNDTVNTEWGLLKTALNWGVKIHLLDSNPMLGVQLPKKKSVVRFLSTEEETRLMEALALPEFQRWRPLVMIARGTGVRMSNLRGLQWDRVDLFRKAFWVARSKNDQPLWVPLTNQVHDIFLDLYKDRGATGGLVFPGPNGEWSRYYLSDISRRICRSAGIADFRFHDYRHDFGTRVTMAGGDIGATQALMGHKDVKSTLRYSHMQEERSRRALEKMEKDQPDASKKEVKNG